jgi:hypothetical protein
MDEPRAIQRESSGSLVTRRWCWTVVVLAAVSAVVAPLPPGVVERYYSRGVYPPWQRAITSASNLVPFALFDVLWVGGVAVLAVAAFRQINRLGWRRGLVRLAIRAGLAACVLYLAFLACWGLNYRRPPIVERVAYDSTRVTSAAAAALGRRTVVELNALYPQAHGAPPPSLTDLARAFSEGRGALGDDFAIVPGRPKQTLLGAYFHQTWISGMTDPFFLETLVAPDLLDVEKPFVVEHEWAHLAGYADESEANFVAWIACMHGPPAAQYSAWLMMFGYLDLAARSVEPALDIGPRTDLFSIARRYARTNPVLRAAARRSYDAYLKANRVEAGVVSYDLVVRLVLGTEFDPRWDPKLR